MSRIYRGTGSSRIPVGEIYSDLIYTNNQAVVVGHVKGNHIYSGYSTSGELVGSFEGDHIYRGYGGTRIPVGTFENGIVYEGVGGSYRPRIGEADSIEGAAALLLLPLGEEYHYQLGPKNGIPYATKPKLGFGFKGILLILLSAIAWPGLFMPTIIDDPTATFMLPSLLFSIVLGLVCAVRLFKQKTFWSMWFIGALIGFFPLVVACYIVDGKILLETVLACGVMVCLLNALPAAILAIIFHKKNKR